ncbi:hypothetical protein FUAX_15290 [Fulvitalea axinellae]|uniref:FAS1 domain-containing protein n=1 Tax=Fulvitalea axinellae TaxID=1182444 RepID=A0AAU9CUG3_9BACT|nr:hypothetical protein FUAX_15290 [Fulvitalea axinellae]
MIRDTFRKLAALSLCALFFAACDERDEHFTGAGDKETQNVTVGEFLSASSDYRYFADLLDKHGYLDSISGARPVTLLVPPKAEIEALAGSVMEDSMKNVLAYHIGNTLLYRSQMGTGKDQYLKTFYNGKNIWTGKVSGETLSFDRDKMSMGKPVFCTNGVVHIIDGAMTPQTSLFENIQRKGDDFSKYKAEVLKDTLLFDKDNSFPIGVDKWGRTVYDSAFVLGYAFLDEKGDLSDENERYSNIVLSDAAIQATYDGLVQRYYGSSENLPEYFEEDEEFVENIYNQILYSTVLDIETENRKLGDTLEVTNGFFRRGELVRAKLLVTQEWLDHSPTKMSNGLAYELPKVDLLMSHVMGRPVSYDASQFSYFTAGLLGDVTPELGEGGFPTEDPAREPVSNDALGITALHFSSKKPFWVEYRLPASMGGHFDLTISGLKNSTSKAAVYVNGELIDARFSPSGNWNTDNLKGVRTSGFGEKVVRFEVTEFNEEDDEKVYELGLNAIGFFPVAE